MVQFNKKAKSNQEHIQIWQKRGLNIPDIERATRYLNYISYYRFSAYAIPFQIPTPTGQEPTHQFKDETTFDDILNLYIFDRELRLLVMDAIERIEIGIRAVLCNELCLHSNNPFWYTDSEHFKHSYSHERLLDNIKRYLSEERKRLKRDEEHIDKRPISQDEKNTLKERVRKENSLRHYLSKYSSPELPPSWMAFEYITWGDLSNLYGGLKSTPIKKKIAQSLGLHAEVLESWLKTFNDVRNICAHHGRLWNKEFGRSIALPKSRSILWLNSPVNLSDPTIRYEKRTYSNLIALQTLLYKISPNSGWAKRLKNLMDKYPNVSLTYMGMPEEWFEDEFWKPVLKH